LAQGVLRAMFRTRLYRTLGLVLGVGAVLLGVGLLLYPAQADPPRDDRALIQGAWQAVSVERGGQPAPDDYTRSMRLVFADDRVSMPNRGLDEKKGATFKLDPAARPKTIDIVLEKEAKMLGIYELDKETLKLCLVEAGTPRPTEFVGKDRQVLIVFRRAA